MKKTNYNISNKKAFTLLEVLLSVLLLSFAFIGIAGALVVIHKSNNSSFLKQNAIQYTSNIIEKMRANRVGAINGNYNFSLSPSVPTNFDCFNVTCTSQQIAQNDLSVWMTNVTNILPNAQASVSTSQINNNTQVVVTIDYTDASGTFFKDASGNMKSYTLTTLL